MCYLQGSCPPRAVWVEEGCGYLRGASYRRNLLQPAHSWHHSMYLNKTEFIMNITSRVNSLHHFFFFYNEVNPNLHPSGFGEGEFQYLGVGSSEHTAPPRWRCWAHLEPSECRKQRSGPPNCAGKTEKRQCGVDVIKRKTSRFFH